VADQYGPDPLLAFAEGMATRLCHDVAGLASTIAGMLEMALEDAQGGKEAGADGEAAALATEAAQLLAARIRLYRAAWGGGDMEAGTIQDLAAGLPNRSKLTLSIDPALTAERLTGAGPRLLLCILLAACAALPAGGTITVTAAEGSGFAVTLAGRNAAWPEALTGAQAWRAADARTLAVPMAALVAAENGWCITHDGLRITALPLAARARGAIHEVFGKSPEDGAVRRQHGRSDCGIPDRDE
jgi:hypothetical protein